MSVVIYTKKGCPFCEKAQDLAELKGIPYTAVTMPSWCKTEYGITTAPAIFIDDVFIGGYAEMRKHDLFKGDMREYSQVYKPFTYPEMVELAKTHAAMHWTEDEVSLAEDIKQWSDGTLNKDEKSFITNVLRLFTQSDVAVAKNYGDLFIPTFKNNEVRMWLYGVAEKEVTHQKAYALLNDSLGFPEAEYAKFLRAYQMSDKVDFMFGASTSTMTDLALALARSMVSEGMFLFASFAMLLNFSRFGKMPGMRDVVEWSIKDESMHCQGLKFIFRTFCDEHPRIVTDGFKKTIYTMFRDAVLLEDKFIDYVFADYKIEGLDRDSLKQYVRYVADMRLKQLGLKPNWNVNNNPLPWMEYLVSSSVHTNFFESKATDYSKGSMTGEWNYSFIKEAACITDGT